MSCTICLEPFKKPVAFGCGHVFCEACAMRLHQGYRYDIPCPTCRRSTSGRPINLYGIESAEAQSAGAVEEATESFKNVHKNSSMRDEKVL